MSIFGAQFYHNTMRKYVATFGTMFNEMTITRYTRAGAAEQIIQVPISYAAKEKWLARLTADPELKRPIAAQLPGMSYELTGLSYDPTRKLSPLTAYVKENNNTNRVSVQYTPVPYNLDFALYIYVKNMDDGLQLVEQILPFFGPEWTNTINLIPSMGISKDVPTTLNTITYDDTYEGSFEDRRAIVWTLTFTMKGYFFGPVRSSGVIKRATTNLGVIGSPALIEGDFITFDTNFITGDEIDNTTLSSRVTITPGLLANGSPTTNAAASIPVNQIAANSNYGFVTNTEFLIS